ncbi:MAG: hypothetical protein HRT42_14450, partial [Campylobacteraceae bacterium]|nr:hypothetical protein [Campylobacteraceae bacterium]
CFYCGVTLCRWQADDDVKAEHYKYSPPFFL